MIKNIPVHILKGLQNLTQEELENILEGQEKLFIEQNVKYRSDLQWEWTEKCISNGVFFDLSQVRWVNIGAATQLTLLIEYAKKKGVEVFVALPTKVLTSREQKADYSYDIKHNILKARKRVNSFLKVIQFDKAIKCEHIDSLTNVWLTEIYEFQDKKNDINIEQFNLSFESEIENTNTNYSQYNYKFILPLTWIGIVEEYNPEGFERELSKILTNDQRGLDNIDALSLKNVILSELIKNVKEHAGNNTSHALLSIGLLPTTTLAKKNKEDEIISYSNSKERDYIEALNKNEIKNNIEIYFGDSGKGLINDLKEEFEKQNNIRTSGKKGNLNILQWAFNKWSTSKIHEENRGTKGLYRIKRIVNKYNGIVLIRNSDLCGGYQKGGYSTAKWIANTETIYFSQPGTFIQIKLCPNKESTNFNYSIKDSRSDIEWEVKRYELNEESLHRFDKWFSRLKALKSDENLFLIFQSDNKIKDVEIGNFLNENLEIISRNRHPNAVVIYLADDIGESTLENIIDSTNEMILNKTDNLIEQEAISYNNEDVYDPVLVIGHDNKVYWYGGSQNIINVLNELYKINIDIDDDVRLENLVSFKEIDPIDKKRILRHFYNDDSLVRIIDNNKIEFHFSDTSKFYKNRLMNFLKENEKEKNKEKIICSPKLEPISKWYKIKDMLDYRHVVGYALAMYIEFEKKYNYSINRKKTHILIDHSQQKVLAVEFAKLKGVDKLNIVNTLEDVDYNIPRRTKLFDKDDDVIIITTIISTSETIRRMIKYVRRDLARPITILCLINTRKYDIDKIHTWEKDTDIISIYQINNEEQKSDRNIDFQKIKDGLNKCTSFISPKYIEEPIIENIEDRVTNLIPSELKELFIKKKALHYNHIGNYNERHYTFYPNKKVILRDKELIWKKYKDKISAWKISKNIEDFSIIKPEFNNEDSGIFDELIRYLKKEFKSVKIISCNKNKSIEIEERNVVYIDFGALTGSSINKLFKSLKNCNYVLINILFSQFQNGELDFYKRIHSIITKAEAKKLSTSLTIKSQGLQPTLFDEKDVILKYTYVSIEMIYNLPIYFYNSSNCPICEHNKSLEKYKTQDKYMIEFANDRKNRLKINDRKNVNLYPCDFYCTGDDNQYELSSVLIMKMYELKLLLEKALHSTQYRIVVFNFLFEIHANIDDEINKPDSDLYAFLYLISNEVNWLQREPLVFKNLRKLIAFISKSVANVRLEELISHFEDKIKYNNTPKNVAVRNKYAAISVSRSSDKYEFCKNISNIIKTSYNGNALSDNLVQNAFYHINSLHQNNYNKSEKYYHTIEKELKKIETNKINFSHTQEVAINNIMITNKKILNQFDNSLIKRNSLQIIKKLKEEVSEEYESIVHPRPAKHFENLDFRQIGYDKTAWNSLKTEGVESVFFEDYEVKSKKLIANWKIAKTFIETVIIQFKKIDEKIARSEGLKRFETDVNTYLNDSYAKLFEELIIKISDDPLNLINNTIKYHELYDFIHKLFFKYAKKGESDLYNSKLLNLFFDFPSDIVDAINSYFHDRDFKKFKFIKNAETFDVFYPKTQLDYYIEHIRKNIQKHSKDLSLNDDISVFITLEKQDKTILLTIKNTVLKDSKIEFKKNSGLSLFKNDVERYGGSVDHKIIDGFFLVKLKFENYENT